MPVIAGNPIREGWLSLQKSAEAIVPCVHECMGRAEHNAEVDP
jgi:hypothetical protein